MYFILSLLLYVYGVTFRTPMCKGHKMSASETWLFALCWRCCSLTSFHSSKIRSDKLLREPKPSMVLHLSQNQLGWGFGKLHFLFYWLNIDLSFRALWWYYSVELIFPLVCLEPRSTSMFWEVMWVWYEKEGGFLSLLLHCWDELWLSGYHSHLTVRRNRCFHSPGLSLQTVPVHWCCFSPRALI